MMLKRVDLPQPDGPITARNSPGATLNDMRSTATIGPSGVSKRLETSSTTRMASAGRGASARRLVAAVTMRSHLAPSWAGLSRPSTSLPQAKEYVYARDKPGHDGECGSAASRLRQLCRVMARATLGP